MSRLVLATLAFLVALAAPVGAAGGTDQQEPPPPPPPEEPPITVDDHVLVVRASYPGTLGLTEEPTRTYSGPELKCAYFSIIVGGYDLIDVVPAPPEPGETYLWYCWEQGNHPYLEPYDGYPIVVVFDPAGDPPGAIITTPDAAQHAVDNIAFEAPVVATAPTEDHVVGVPTWLAVTSEIVYDPVSAQAGPVWATVRPEFRDVVWDLGNGDEVTCIGHARNAWDPQGGEGQSSACTYTYESSGDETFAGAATITWTIWQQTNRNPSTWTVWGEVSLTSAVDFEVTELEAAIN